MAYLQAHGVGEHRDMMWEFVRRRPSEKGRPAFVADKIGDELPREADQAREREKPQQHVGGQRDDKQRPRQCRVMQ